MKKLILILCVLVSLSMVTSAQDLKTKNDMLVRISEIEVHPQYLQEYLSFALNVGAASVTKEPGVICIFPMQQKRDSCQIRILEIYADEATYKSHIASEHFQTYKQGSLHMVKKLDLVDMRPMNESDMKNIFKKMDREYSTIFKTENRASNEYNTGMVHVSVHKDSGNTMITTFLFEPNSRNFWHYHPDAEQTLMVLNGEGYYQEEGKEKQLIKKGDIIVTPANVRHWNGAAPDSSIECMTITEHAVDNHAVQLRAVRDDEYNK